MVVKVIVSAATDVTMIVTVVTVAAVAVIIGDDTKRTARFEQALRRGPNRAAWSGAFAVKLLLALALVLTMLFFVHSDGLRQPNMLLGIEMALIFPH